MEVITETLLAASTGLALLAAPIAAVDGYFEKPVSCVVPWPPAIWKMC